jgi:HEAT repeat protein
MPPNIDKLKAKGKIHSLIRVLGKEKYFYDSTAEKAANALGEIGNERAILPLIGAKRLRREKGYVVYDALKRIIERSDKEKVIKVLNKNLKRDLVLGFIGDHNRMVIRFLGDLKHPGAVPTLIDILTNKPSRKSCSVRTEAALALGEIGDERAVEPLITALSFSDRYVVWTDQGTLGKIYGDFEMDVKRAAEKALAKIGAPAIVNFPPKTGQGAKVH